MHGSAELQDFPARQLGVEHRLIRQKSYEPFDLHPIFEGITPLYTQHSLSGLEYSHKQTKQSGFSGAIGSEQTADLPGGDGKGNIFKGGLGSEGFGDTADLNQSAGVLCANVRDPNL